MVKPKTSWFSNFGAKDFFAALTFICGLSIHFQAIQQSNREMIIEVKGDIKVINIRLDNIEGKRKPISYHPSQDRLAILPSQTQITDEQQNN